MEIMMMLQFVTTWGISLLPFIVYVWLYKLFSDRLCQQSVTHSIAYFFGLIGGGLMVGSGAFILLAKLIPIVIRMLSEVILILNIPYTMLMQLFSYSAESTGLTIVMPFMQVLLLLYSTIIFIVVSIVDYKRRCAIGLLCLAHLLSFLIAHGIQLLSITVLLKHISL